MLADEGWDVGKGVTNTAEVVKEAPVKYQVGASGEGKADYVLEDDNGKPLGVVEAKKTATDPQIGRKQAEQYADGLEKERGQRPVIFYTNGHDLWIWNDSAGEPPRKIYGFYSKDSLQHIHYQRGAKKPLSEVYANPDPTISRKALASGSRPTKTIPTPDFADRTQNAFFVPKSEIQENAYDLSINRYKEIIHEEEKYDSPKVILKRLKKFEAEIAKDLEELERMLG